MQDDRTRFVNFLAEMIEKYVLSGEEQEEVSYDEQEVENTYEKGGDEW